uniref:Uncharacterized protein n=1 Tax=Arundo donax TaxID=35708 RepID=A0A0A9GQW5_ARUDO
MFSMSPPDLSSATSLSESMIFSTKDT